MLRMYTSVMTRRNERIVIPGPVMVFMHGRKSRLGQLDILLSVVPLDSVKQQLIALSLRGEGSIRSIRWSNGPGIHVVSMASQERSDLVRRRFVREFPVSKEGRIRFWFSAPIPIKEVAELLPMRVRKHAWASPHLVSVS